ncbi:phage replisome organizer N-terminal domain-containing protein [Lactococcus hircilactis]|uniref:phage replisome organizer N-terminal domain-containing protein n=1 Tax=Lactococcus hircilactis TaxID=1494462 RepID=UPI003FA30D15
MADNKKYYYMRLKENFFDSDEMIILENMDNGDGIIYSNILLKLYLRSLKYEGRLMFNERIPFNPQMLSTIVRHPVGVVEKAIKAFIDLGLVEVMDNGAIYMLDIQNFIGKTSTEAERKKIYRDRISKEKIISSGQMSGQLSDVRTPEIELEKERDIKKEKEREKEYNVEENLIFPDYLSEKTIESIKKGNPKNFNFRIPIAYLNQVTDSNFKFVDVNLNLVKARLKDGFELDDFKKVIDVKFAEWANTDMAKYIRPKTLFAPKNFDSYLNQKSAVNNYGNRIVKEAPKWASNGKPPEEEELTPEEAEAFFNGY